MAITDVIQELLIVKGLPPAPGDTTTAEQPMTAVNLMTSGVSGFALDSEDGWAPNIPALKGGGLWADSAISAGRQLIAAEDGNVLETMHLILTGSTIIDLAGHLLQMNTLIADARNFWATEWQIEPVYIRWYAKGAPGPQYALIHNIEMAMDEPDVMSNPIRDVTITIEREPYWRPIPPGANPKLWTAEFRHNTIANADDLYLGARALTFTNARNNLFQTNGLENSREWNVGQTGVTSENYIDIPAADIPGDAPALVNMVLESPSNSSGGFLVGRQAKPTSLTGRDGTTNKSVLVLNAGDYATLGSDASIQADTGAPNSNNQSSGQRGRVTFATASLVDRFTWRKNDGTPETRPELTLLRGTYAVFARVRLSAAGTVTLKLTYGIDSLSNIANDLRSTTDVGAGGTGNSTLWACIYMGSMSIPVNAPRVSVGADGKGVLVLPDDVGLTTSGNLRITLQAARTSGACDLYVADLVLIPVDECSIHLSTDSSGFLGSTGALIYDNTGYMMHGRLDDYASYWRYVWNDNVPSETDPVDLRGGRFMLQPGVNNRLHFLRVDTVGTQSIVKETGNRVYLNIVPRFRSIRTV